MRRSLRVLVAVALCGALSPGTLSGQDFMVGVNLGELARFGTLNVTVGYALDRHWSLDVEGRVNPWTFGKMDETAEFFDSVKSVNRSVFCRGESIAAGVRYWPWYFLSEGWVGLRGRCASYDFGGWILGPGRRRGTGYGASLGAGWCFMLTRDMNLDVGVYGWGGYRRERVYPDLYFVNQFEDREGWFVGFDEVVVSLVFCF